MGTYGTIVRIFVLLKPKWFIFEPDLNELLWSLGIARIMFGPQMSIWPPNLSPGVLSQIVNSGINDWGGVSPVTPDFVTKASWPHLDDIKANHRRETPRR